MPKRGNRKRLKERGHVCCAAAVTVADYADSDPAIVKSGRVKKAVANAIQKEVKLLCGLEASQVPVEEIPEDHLDCNKDGDELKISKKKKSKRHQDDGNSGEQYPIDIWLFLASYIRPEDVGKFALICKSAWTVTCTAAFWTRLYKRCYHSDVCLPARLQPEGIDRFRCLRICVIRSLYYMYEPFHFRLSEKPAIPESTPDTLQNCSCLLYWCKKGTGNRQDQRWEFSYKFKKQSPKLKNGYRNGLQFPRQYEQVHRNPDQDCYLLQITTLNFIFTPVVMGMTLTLFTINVSSDMRHHRVRMIFQDSPIQHGKKLQKDQGLQVILDPVQSVRLLDWWHPQFPFSYTI
ncbi:transmembrane protein 183A [Callorhinchus milii]|uniref:Transmembrane protein 183A n=1 Tax=Callorhinchus milii TaxID=7868 RepID=V9KGH1_CALMI|nr:transmembrane protein 183A [Callorhinchus milii]|eukprot:gi/632953307/ref/XP_007892346.1/ PREDICTED: transmembrane protein 183A [Callorhinchus milii]